MKPELFIIIRGDKRLADAVFNYGKDWPLLRDHHAELVDSKRHAELLPDAPSYWTVKPGEHGIVMDESAFRYTTTVDQLRQGMSDFMAGWHQAIAK